ncbi:hypothetical protein PanWU01x14_309560, partial [Parasponia andersonii]
LSSKTSGDCPLGNSLKYRTDSIQLISMQSSLTKPNSGKLFCINGISLSTPPRNRELNEACIVLFPSIEIVCKTSLTNRFSSNFSATYCHRWTSLVAFCVKFRLTVKTVTVDGTGSSRIFHDRTTPKLAPPPPRMAQKTSSPINFLSRILPSASTRTASTILSAASPYFLNIVPYPPPLKCPPTPTVGQIPAGKPRFPLFSAIL